MTKADFFTYHKTASGKIMFYLAGNNCIMTARQFDTLSNVIICIAGIDYAINATSIVKL